MDEVDYGEEDEDEDEDGSSVDLEECYVVTEDYSKTTMDELDMFEGQVVCVIDDSDRGELGNSWFPLRPAEKWLHYNSGWKEQNNY